MGESQQFRPMSHEVAEVYGLNGAVMSGPDVLALADGFGICDAGAGVCAPRSLSPTTAGRMSTGDRVSTRIAASKTSTSTSTATIRPIPGKLPSGHRQKRPLSSASQQQVSTRYGVRKRQTSRQSKASDSVDNWLARSLLTKPRLCGSHAAMPKVSIVNMDI